MNTETLERLEALLPGLQLPWTADDIANGIANWIDAENAAEALNALPALLSIAERAADVEGVRAVVAQSSSDWPGPNMGEVYAGKPAVTKPAFIATAVSRYVLGGK